MSKRLMRAVVVVEADAVADGGCRVLDAVEALAMEALLLDPPDHTLVLRRRTAQTQVRIPPLMQGAS